MLNAQKRKITIILADDHALVIEGLRGLLSREPDMEVVATVTSGEALLDELQYTRPDVVVLDVQMQGGDGFWCVFDPVDRNVVYAESQDGGLGRYDRKSGETTDIQPQPGK